MSGTLATLRTRGVTGGRMAAQALVQRTTAQRTSSLLFDSFHGSYSDNPRAVYEELTSRPQATGLTTAWVAHPAESAFPAGVRRIDPQGLSGQRRVGEAGIVVANLQMPSSFQKRGAFYLQTWHGTPLKRLGADNESWTNSPAQQRQMRDYQRWDLLLSPNRFSSDIFRRAFRYGGEILESGYPRNDVLNAPDRDARRAEVRRELGIAPEQRVLFYVPTFRDDQWDASGALKYVHRLDVPLLQQRLGGDDVVLIRLHDRVRRDPAAAKATAPGGPVRDVSLYPDINLLYLAADVLITDYSSAMFDFAVTGKPMLFYTYDLEHYRDTLRGFYLDFETEAPGPLLRTTAEVADALGDLPATGRTYADRYARFRETYCYLDDGKAAQRVVDRILTLI